MRNTDLKTDVMTGYEVKTRTVKILEPNGGGIASEFTTYHVYQDEGNDRIYTHCYDNYPEMIFNHPELIGRESIE